MFTTLLNIVAAFLQGTDERWLQGRIVALAGVKDVGDPVLEIGKAVVSAASSGSFRRKAKSRA